MHQEINKRRLRSVLRMLREMAAGNYTKQIERSEENDEIEALVITVNMLAEEKKESASHYSLMNPHSSFKSIIQTTFILDEDFTIKSCISCATVLGFTTDFLSDKEFVSLLSQESLVKWEEVEQEILLDPFYQKTVELVYIGEDSLLLPSLCSIYRLSNCSKILVSSVTTSVEETLMHDDFIDSGAIEQSGRYGGSADVKMIQKVYDYVLEHLDTPLPSIVELARIFGTNDYKLKIGFKLLFKTTIYQFYSSERLKKAYLLIQLTSMPLKTVSSMCGFATYPNFSTKFKKEFGNRPTDIKRRELGK